MFCSKCGTQINDKLNYCNICGDRLSKNEEVDNSRQLLNTLLKSVGFISVAGLGLFVGLIAVLLNKGLTHEAIAFIAGCYLATLFGICFSLTRFVSRFIELREKTEKPNQVFQPVQLPAPTTAQLEEPRQPPISVTEHTTRTFDEAFVKRT